jgi:CSLREA domain-containing protein
VFLKAEKVGCDVSAQSVSAQQTPAPCPIIVDSTGDGEDTNTKDLACEDKDGKCTLRAAIQESNARDGKDTISFDIGSGGLKTITPKENLPIIYDPVVIDATTQLGYSGSPLIQIDGIKVPRPRNRRAKGLDISSEGSLVRGFAIFNFQLGIALSGTLDTLEASYVGTNADGSTGVGNDTGVEVSGKHNTVGGTEPSARNVISGNEREGIAIHRDDNQVRGNYIGLTPSGDGKLPNGIGIYVDDCNNNLIGGPEDGAGNVISGNKDAGIKIYGRIIDSPSMLTVVQNNLIGTDPTGTKPVGNKVGVEIDQSSQNIIGGFRDRQQGNVISGNEKGIYIPYGAGKMHPWPAPQSNLIAGNLIGTTSSGGAKLPNETGIFLENGSKTLVGGSQAGAGNVISGNKVGIDLGGDSKQSKIQGNFIGTDASGDAPVPNDTGVMEHSQHDLIGGEQPGAGNVISGNEGAGMRVLSYSLSKRGRYETHAVIKGNRIGLGNSGGKLPNGLDGVNVSNIARVMIGGDVPAAANTISGNARDGVRLHEVQEGKGFGAEQVRILGNYIGTDATGADRGNGGNGISIVGSKDNRVGGGTYTAPGCSEGCNVVAFNALAGISVTGSHSKNNLISRNKIYSNGGLGIDLGAIGVTLNDPGDADDGPNLLQNFPVLTRSGAIVSGTFEGPADQRFTLEFFTVTTCDASGNGEGEVWQAEALASTDAKGRATFSVGIDSLTNAEHVTAVLIDAKTNTSEFSNCL